MALLKPGNEPETTQKAGHISSISTSTLDSGNIHSCYNSLSGREK